METLFILIGIYLGGANMVLDVRVIDTYARPGRCDQDAQELTELAKEEKKPYKFYCRGAKFTVT